MAIEFAPESNREWHTSSFTNGGGACVEVAWDGAERSLIRDSKDSGGLILEVDGTAFANFVGMAASYDTLIQE